MNIPQVVLQPASGPESRRRYRRTIARSRPTTILTSMMDHQSRVILEGFHRVHVWGFTGRGRTCSTWSRMNKNDLVAFYREGNFISLCKVIGKCQSSNLARHLWDEDEIRDTWRYIYFLDSPRDISVPVEGVNRAVGNAEYYYRQAEIYRNARLIEELCGGLDDDIVEALLKPDQFNI